MLSIEYLLLRTIAELKGSSSVSLNEIETYVKLKDDNRAVLLAELLSETTGIKLPNELARIACLPSDVSLNWTCNNNDRLTGEINLNGLTWTINQKKLKVYYNDGDIDEEERIKNDYLAKGYWFDMPSTTVGWDTGAVLMWEPGKMEYPEVWFMDEYEKFFPLQLNLGTYFEALYLTKGFLFWQCLFLESAHYRQVDYATRTRFETGYPLLKQTFPEHDYTELDKLFEKLNQLE